MCQYQLKGPVQVHSGCLLSGLDLTSSSCIQRLPLSSDIIVQGHRVMLGELKLTVYTAFGAHDHLEVSFRVQSLILPVHLTYVFIQSHLQMSEFCIFVLKHKIKQFMLVLCFIIWYCNYTQAHADDVTASFLNQKWSEFYSRTGIQ